MPSPLTMTQNCGDFGMPIVLYYIIEASGADMQLRPNCVLHIMWSAMSKSVNILFLLAEKNSIYFWSVQLAMAYWKLRIVLSL